MVPTTPNLAITDPQVRARLEATAEYLAGLSDKQFTMLLYSNKGRDPASVLTAGHDHCGCIAGHIPKIAPALTAALVDEEEALTWHGLAEAFIRQEQVDKRTEEVLFHWLFDVGWWCVDNTKRAAIERVRIALDDGVPSAFVETRGLNPVGYARDNPSGAPGVPSRQNE